MLTTLYSWFWSCPFRIIFKGKLLPGKAFLLHSLGWSANTTFQDPEWTQLLPQGNVAARPRKTEKWFISALSWFLKCASEVFPTREGYSEDAIRRIREVWWSLVRNTLLSHFTEGHEELKPWFLISCLGDLEKITRITSGLKLMIIMLFHPKGKTKCPVFKYPHPHPDQSQLCGYPRGEVLEQQVRLLQTIQNQREKVLYRKEWFPEESSHLYDIKG